MNNFSILILSSFWIVLRVLLIFRFGAWYGNVIFRSKRIWAYVNPGTKKHGYIYNYCTQNLFKANEETYIKYISQLLVKNTEKAKEIGE